MMTPKQIVRRAVHRWLIVALLGGSLVHVHSNRLLLSYSCTLERTGADTVQLAFGGDRGNTEELRVNDQWKATVTGLDEYTLVVTTPPAQTSIEVRLRGNGYTVAPDGFTAVICSESAPSGWNLIWQDDFESPQVDLHKWQIFVGAYGTPYRVQTYTANNVRVENGSLFLKATVDDNDNYFSGMVSTNDVREPENPKWAKGNLGWTFGKFEIRAKIPHGYGLWPALWMRPIGNIYPGADNGSTSWPANGEIDIMEYIGPGRDPNQPNAPVNELVQNMHYQDTNGNRKQDKHTFPVDSNVVSQQFHVYTVEWEANVLRFYWDGALVHTVENWDSFQGSPKPFDQPFDIIMNLQIGGWAGPPDRMDYPAEMEIDWVKVYERDTTPVAPATPPVSPPMPMSPPTPSPVSQPGGSDGGGGLAAILAFIIEILRAIFSIPFGS